MAAPSLEQSVDQGWDIEPERSTTGSRSVERLEHIIREALRILDGVEPEEVALAGDGWSLVEPDAKPGPRLVSVPVGPLTSAIGEALDAAFGDGWSLDDED